MPGYRGSRALAPDIPRRCASLGPPIQRRARSLGASTVRLLYGTTSALQVELTERFFGSSFKLYFADELNPGSNPPSSNPYRILLDYQEIFACNDRLNPKFVKHINGLKWGVRKRLQDDPAYPDARDTIKAMGMHGIRPVLAILEGDTYEAHGKAIGVLPPGRGGSPTSVEYQLADVHGPKHAEPELHLHRLF